LADDDAGETQVDSQSCRFQIVDEAVELNGELVQRARREDGSLHRLPGKILYEMLRQVDVEKQPVSQASKTFGFSRPSFYQAQAAFQEAGLAGLLPQKRGPRSGHKLTPELMQFVAQLRLAEPAISSPQLAERIAQRFGISVHPRSIDRQLQRQKKLR
jgi:transposase